MMRPGRQVAQPFILVGRTQVFVKGFFERPLRLGRLFVEPGHRRYAPGPDVIHGRNCESGRHKKRAYQEPHEIPFMFSLFRHNAGTELPQFFLDRCPVFTSHAEQEFLPGRKVFQFRIGELVEHVRPGED
jgi:hypothetical protein